MLVAITGCAGSRVVGEPDTLRESVSRIAAAPIGGEAADRLIAGLKSAGLRAECLTTAECAALLKELDVPSTRAELAENRERLLGRGVDAWLLVERTDHPVSADPSAIHVRLISLRDPTQAIDFTWKNAWGGMQGSLADAAMRKGDEEASSEAAAELVARLERAGVAITEVAP
jgi:hypothetical protein